MKFAVVTTFARRHWDSHARRCVETFRQHWPTEVPLLMYEDATLETYSDWLPAFKQRHRDKPTANYRMDAVRFAHKVAAIDCAIISEQTDDVDVLIWMDADCVTHAPVATDWLAGLIKEADFAYLKRLRKYPECGVMMTRLNERGISFWQAVVDQYRTDRLFTMAEWHDSWVIEQVRDRFERIGRLSCISLSGIGERTHHPLINGPLGARLDHLKGQRKTEGRSRPLDLKVRRNEPYWKGPQ